MVMLAKERQSVILEMLQEKNIIRITDIVRQFDVSNETARRDLEAMQDQKLVKRIYGGAILLTPRFDEPRYPSRIALSYKEKAAIGKAAAALVHEGDTVYLDTGTTMLKVAENLKYMNNLVVVTNSLPIINELANSNVNVYVLGGRLNPDELCMCGKITVDASRKFFVDKAFLSAGGVTLTNGVTDYGEDDTSHRSIMLEQAEKVILAADNRKFGVNSFYFVCDLDKIDIVISDSRLSKEYIDKLRERKIDVILAEIDTDNNE